VTWASPSLSFYPFFISSHHSPIPTLENFLHTKLNTILLAMFSISIIVDQPFLVQVSTQKYHILNIYYCSNFLKSSVIKRTKKESDQEANTNSGRNLSKQNS
jgi:hypothetical protein